MMDVYEGKFRSNGGCGYVLKPAVMREHISVFSAATKETIPGVTPQHFKIKVSGIPFLSIYCIKLYSIYGGIEAISPKTYFSIHFWGVLLTVN